MVLIQLVGFVCLLLGNFIYNEVIEIKFMGFNKNLKRYLTNKESKADTVVDE